MRAYCSLVQACALPSYFTASPFSSWSLSQHLEYSHSEVSSDTQAGWFFEVLRPSLAISCSNIRFAIHSLPTRRRRTRLVTFSNPRRGFAWQPALRDELTNQVDNSPNYLAFPHCTPPKKRSAFFGRVASRHCKGKSDHSCLAFIAIQAPCRDAASSHPPGIGC